MSPVIRGFTLISAGWFVPFWAADLAAPGVAGMLGWWLVVLLAGYAAACAAAGWPAAVWAWVRDG